MITRSPEQYNDNFNIEEKIREIGEYEGGIVIFDDMLDCNQKQTDPFFTRSQDIKIKRSTIHLNHISIY